MDPRAKRLAGTIGGLFSSVAVEHPEPPERGEPAGPPDGRALAGEALAGVQIPRLIASAPRLARAPRGDGGPVVDIPGWRAPESSMAPLRAYLRRLGHDARTWGLGTNMGDPQGDAVRMTESVRELALETGRPVALVGWSLGGVIAREVAREIPEHVSQVITYGTPIVGGPVHTIAARNYSREDRDEIERVVAEVNARSSIDVPLTVIFSKRDGIVAWEASIDDWSPRARHIEVKSTHLGLGIDPDVWMIVARALASPPG